MPDRSKGARSFDIILEPQGRPSVALDAYRVRVSPQGTPGIVQNSGADWFGPLNPMVPVAPPEVAGRAFDFQAGANLEISTRPYEPIKYSDLRALSDSLDLLRLVIETRKDQMERMTWAIKSQVLADGTSAVAYNDPVIQEISDFFQMPDGEHDWGTWLRLLLEDLFVIDAPTIYYHRTSGNRLLSLDVIDGATIKRVIDDWGRTPAPPAPAYQQILKGLPAVNYTTDDMLWMPRNTRVHKFMGFSPVEQVITIVNIAIRKQLYMLQYFTAGNIPEALIGVPEEWKPEQISKFQQWFDSLLEGNQAARRKGYFVPGGVAKTFIPTKEPDLTGKTDEWLARVICYAFSLSPQAFVSMMNRSTAETAHQAATEEGLFPVMNWVARFVNRIIRRFWPGARVEFAWNDDTQVDKLEQSQVLDKYVTRGTMKLNEARDVLGLDPIPEGNVSRVLTPNGYVKVDANDDAPTAGQAAQQKQDQAKSSAGALADRTHAVPAAAGIGDAENDNKTGKEALAAKMATAPFRKGDTLRKGKWAARYWARRAVAPARSEHDSRHATREGSSD